MDCKGEERGREARCQQKRQTGMDRNNTSVEGSAGLGDGLSAGSWEWAKERREDQDDTWATFSPFGLPLSSVLSSRKNEHGLVGYLL